MLFKYYYYNTPILIGGMRSSDYLALLQNPNLTDSQRASYQKMYERALDRETRHQTLPAGYTEPYHSTVLAPPSRFDNRQSALSILEERFNTGSEDQSFIRPDDDE